MQQAQHASLGGVVDWKQQFEDTSKLWVNNAVNLAGIGTSSGVYMMPATAGSTSYSASALVANMGGRG